MNPIPPLFLFYFLHFYLICEFLINFTNFLKTFIIFSVLPECGSTYFVFELCILNLNPSVELN